jgi:uncharacterized protein YndB with AHSA1/START domain
MPKLFVDKKITINAPAPKVWNALTKRENTDAWAREFSSGGPQFHLESAWELGAPVLWKGEDGNTVVKGTVTALEPNKLLRFTVFDVRHADAPQLTEDDGITCELKKAKGKTTLRVLQGDFSAMEEGEKYRNLSAEIWDRVLPKIKEIAEAPAEEKERTCGKGLAESAALPAKLGEVIASVAENLEIHLDTLDRNDERSKHEYDAYEKLALEHREIALRLTAVADAMVGFWDLPMGHHDPAAMADPKVMQAFEKLIRLERDLVSLLERRAEDHKALLAGK